MKRTLIVWSNLKLAAVIPLLAVLILWSGCKPKPPPPPPPAAKSAAVAAASTNAPEAMATNAVASDTVSVFEIVKCQGKDPFYPTSLRLCGDAPVASGGPAAPTKLPLMVNGVVSSPSGTLVIINGRSFSVNEKGRVPVPKGMARIQVLEIRKDSVLIKADDEDAPRVLPLKH